VRPGAEPKLSTGVLRATRVARGAGWSHEVRPSVMAEVRCAVGARGLGTRGEEVLTASHLLVGRSVPLIDLFALISDRLRVDSR
jgi:hypothetical protein